MSQQENIDKITNDLLKPIRFNMGFKIWMGFLLVALLICLYAYSLQLRTGLGVAGIRDYVAWGMYIANFVFFVATSLIGMLISAVLGLLEIKWAAPISRIAEIIALAFAAVAGIVIIMDMGRPERLAYVFIHGRVQSPIIWDVTVVTTYVVLSALLFYLPLIPDIKICHDKLEGVPKMQRAFYRILSLGWTGTPEQLRLITKSIRLLLILIIPVALGIHTVTSWLFASTSRPGWDSTIFGPYFVAGAFVSGCAAVIIAMYFFRKNYKLNEYLTDELFDKMGKLLVLVSLVYLYFNLNEFLVPAYKMKKFDAVHLREIFTGAYALMFWSVQLLGLVIPIILLLFNKARKPLPMLIIAIFVFTGAWFKRYIIVVPTQLHPYLPIQNVPEYFKFYTPTLIETAITLTSFILVLMIITILAKIFPVIPISDPTSKEQ
ncbi:MAG: NrfD/PsrC family molybdoenzyme membrane anchor subunit [Bacteroidota bacterium]|nr:NrfD/PsrC family molybdoenzyme membrane anchor subunit [Bacteroidota bacterium]